MKQIILSIFLGLGICAHAYGKQYITGASKVTFRMGPGTSHKIISMIEADTGVSIVEAGDTWTKVKSEGKEGYVMSRFLTTEVPYSLRYKWLKGHYEKLKEEVAEFKEKEKALHSTLSETKRELASTKENLETTSSSYQELRSGSQEYLDLKSRYDKTSKELTGSNKEVAILKEKLSLYYFTWFLAGAGVLLLGWMIGFFSKRKKASGYGNSIKL